MGLNYEVGFGHNRLGWTKVNGLDLGSELGPNRWVGPKYVGLRLIDLV